MRRWLFLGSVALVAAGLLRLAWAVLEPGGWSVWEILIFACFAANAPWLGLSAATALAGLAIRLFAADPTAAAGCFRNVSALQTNGQIEAPSVQSSTRRAQK